MVNREQEAEKGEMDAIKPGWFSEINDLWPGVSLSLEVVKVLHRERSQYQDVMVLETKSHGRTLILDGIIQCTERDEFSYQEMIAFLPLCSHPNPKTVSVLSASNILESKNYTFFKLFLIISSVSSFFLYFDQR